MRFSRGSLARRPAALGLLAAAVLCLLLAGRGTAVAQGELSEADKETLRNYELTIPKIDKLEAVARKLVAAAKADPQIRKEIEAVSAEQDTSIDKMTERFNRLAPHATAVLKAEGTDPREFFLGLMSTMLASMTSKAREGGGSEPAPDFVPAGNIAFVEKHRPRIDLLEKAMSDWDKVGEAE